MFLIAHEFPLASQFFTENKKNVPPKSSVCLAPRPNAGKSCFLSKNIRVHDLFVDHLCVTYAHTLPVHPWPIAGYS